MSASVPLCIREKRPREQWVHLHFWVRYVCLSCSICSGSVNIEIILDFLHCCVNPQVRAHKKCYNHLFASFRPLRQTRWWEHGGRRENAKIAGDSAEQMAWEGSDPSPADGARARRGAGSRRGGASLGRLPKVLSWPSEASERFSMYRAISLL